MTKGKTVVMRLSAMYMYIHLENITYTDHSKRTYDLRREMCL